jgi:hypothetical protein
LRVCDELRQKLGASLGHDTMDSNAAGYHNIIESKSPLAGNSRGNLPQNVTEITEENPIFYKLRRNPKRNQVSTQIYF